MRRSDNDPFTGKEISMRIRELRLPAQPKHLTKQRKGHQLRCHQYRRENMTQKAYALKHVPYCGRTCNVGRSLCGPSLVDITLKSLWNSMVAVGYSPVKCGRLYWVRPCRDRVVLPDLRSANMQCCDCKGSFTGPWTDSEPVL